MSLKFQQFTNNDSILISILLGEQQDNSRIQALRQSSLVREDKYIKSHMGQSQMRDISQKLNRLEKALLKKNQFGSKDNRECPTHNHKYEELNSLNERLRKALNSTIGKSNGAVDLQTIERRVVGLYNESVSTLNNQDKLNKRLSSLKEQNESILDQISETKSDIQRAQIELSSIQSLKQISLKRLKKLQSCPFLYH